MVQYLQPLQLWMGKFEIGLSDEDLKILATAENVTKVSRRDLAQVFV